ncbi:MAG: hypothetical protein HQL37_06895 [Alphaproteobacteria bacterium]|nr:hypothetical protein [Alphaproteobacteria bacterium]
MPGRHHLREWGTLTGRADMNLGMTVRLRWCHPVRAVGNRDQVESQNGAIGSSSVSTAVTPIAGDRDKRDSEPGSRRDFFGAMIETVGLAPTFRTFA